MPVTSLSIFTDLHRFVSRKLTFLALPVCFVNRFPSFLFGSGCPPVSFACFECRFTLQLSEAGEPVLRHALLNCAPRFRVMTAVTKAALLSQARYVGKYSADSILGIGECKFAHSWSIDDCSSICQMKEEAARRSYLIRDREVQTGKRSDREIVTRG